MARPKAQLKPAPYMTITERYEHWKKHHPKEWRSSMQTRPSVRAQAKRMARLRKINKQRKMRMKTIQSMLDSEFTMKDVAVYFGISTWGIRHFYMKYQDLLDNNEI